MSNKAECEICGKILSSEDGLASHKRDKHSIERERDKDPVKTKKNKTWFIIIIIGLVIIFGIYWMSVNASNASLPPISMEGHVERVPSSHILKKPMGLSVQKHMLEHIDGEEGVGGGVIINYDCKNFECEGDLIGKLEDFAVKYDYVYVAPFKNMEVKIALTRLGRIEKYDSYDERKMEIFITGKIPSTKEDEEVDTKNATKQ